MTSGGRRKGAGRKKGEHTKQVRIPVRGANVARSLINTYLRVADEKVQETEWYKTCPVKDKIVICLDRYDMRKWAATNGTGVDLYPTIIAKAYTDDDEFIELEIKVEDMAAREVRRF